MNRDLWDLTEGVVGAMIEVHRRLGPGLLEAAYDQCLAAQLRHAGIAFQRQSPITFEYLDTTVDCAYRADFIIEDCVLVELKAVDGILPIHVAQVLTYLKLTRLDVALLVNFNAPTIRSELRRLTRRDQRGSPPAP